MSDWLVSQSAKDCSILITVLMLPPAASPTAGNATAAPGRRRGEEGALFEREKGPCMVRDSASDDGVIPPPASSLIPSVAASGKAGYPGPPNPSTGTFAFAGNRDNGFMNPGPPNPSTGTFAFAGNRDNDFMSPAAETAGAVACQSAGSALPGGYRRVSVRGAGGAEREGLCRCGVVDLDIKRADKIPYYLGQDAAVVEAYLADTTTR